MNGNKGFVWSVLVMATLVAAGASLVNAQQGGGGGGRTPLSEEQMAKAISLEAGTVARALALDKDVAGKLEGAYRDARKAYAANAPEGGQGNFQAVIEYTEGERGKLEKALAAFLKPEQVEKAIGTLGTFGRQWDRMVLAIDGFGMAADKADPAMDEIAGFVQASAKARAEAMLSGDFQSVRDATAKLKEELDAKLAKILSAEHMTKWTEATAFRGRG